MRSRLPAFRATGPGPVFTILPTIEDADTTCPKDTTASSWNKSGLPGTPASPWAHGKVYVVAWVLLRIGGLDTIGAADPDRQVVRGQHSLARG